MPNRVPGLINYQPFEVYPVSAFMFHEGARVTVGNAFNHYHDAAQNYAVYQFQNAPANGDTFTIGFVIAAGTYTFRVLGATALNRGIIDWSVDGGSIVSGQDWYTAAAANNVIKSTTGVVLTSGAHVLKGVVNGKNASSNNFFAALTAYWFE